MFEKRHYEVIAKAMQDSCGSAPVQWKRTRDALADAFARDNPEFKRERFERACEPGANVGART